MNPIDAYLSRFEGEPRLRLDELRSFLARLFPDFEEELRYGIPTLRLKGKNVVHYAAYARHIGLYPGPGALKALEPELRDYKRSKGAVQFPHALPLPFPLIEALVRKSRSMAEL